MSEQQIRLPLQVVGKSDLGRLLREAEAIDAFMQQSSIRQPGTALAMPKLTRSFEECAALNQINLLDTAARQGLVETLRSLRIDAKVIHISFAAEPAPTFVLKLLTWLRDNIHPQLLLQIGLQPDIAAGCTVRTTNKYFDLSLRKGIVQHRQVLLDLMSAKLHPADTTEAALTGVQE